MVQHLVTFYIIIATKEATISTRPKAEGGVANQILHNHSNKRSHNSKKTKGREGGCRGGLALTLIFAALQFRIARIHERANLIKVHPP